MNNVRRAVIVDGKICDKKDHPNSTEIIELSALLEEDRERRGERNISRSTARLVEHAIRQNDTALWKAIVDDIDTGDFDGHAAQVILEQQDILPGLFIGCITKIKETEKMIDVLRVFLELVLHLNERTIMSFSKAISIQWKAFVNALIMTETTSRMYKDGIYECFARFIDAVDIQREDLVLCIKEIIKNRKFEILSIFSRIHSKIYAEDILEDLLNSAKYTSATNRYAVACLIAKVIADDTEIKSDIEPTIKTLLEKTILDKYVDVRTVRALAFVLQKTSNDPVLRNFTTCITWLKFVPSDV